MIITIKRAILHIITDNNPVYSDTELDISDAHINAYIKGQIEKTYANTSLQKGQFAEQSGFLNMLKQNIDNQDDTISFVEFSQFVAKRVQSTISYMDKPPFNVDIIFCKCLFNDKPVFVLLKYESKSENTHRTLFDSGKVHNQIENTMILPTKVSECAFIQEDYSILYDSKLYQSDGERVNFMEEEILECNLETVSSREAEKSIKKQIKNISFNPLESTVLMKKFLVRTVAESDEGTPEYNLNELAEAMFNTPTEKADFIEGNKAAGIISEGEGKLPIDDYMKKKINEKIKIVTDSGIELKFPADFYNDENKMTIETRPDGTKIVTLRNISELQLK